MAWYNPSTWFESERDRRARRQAERRQAELDKQNPVSAYVRRGPKVEGEEQAVQITPYEGYQREFFPRAFELGQKRIGESFEGLNQLTQPISPQQQSINRLMALGQVGSSPGSFAGPLAQLAGGAIGGPAGAALGGVIGSIGGSLFDRFQASQAFGPYEEAARKQFQQQTIPDIAMRFAGTDSLGSSAFRHALGSAASDLESQLAVAKANYSAEQMNQLLKERALANEAMEQNFNQGQTQLQNRERYLGNLQNQGLKELMLGMTPQWETALQGEEPGKAERWLAALAPHILQAAGTIGGAYIAGPPGALAGGELGYQYGNAFHNTTRSQIKKDLIRSR